MPGPPTAGLILHLKADVGAYKDTAGTTPATADGDLVALWQDQSGQGNHVSQATAGNRPTLKAALLNGRPAVRFSETVPARLSTAGPVAHGIGAGDLWFAAVLRWSGGGLFDTALSIGSFNPAFYATVSSGFPCFYLGGQHNFAAIVPGTWYLMEMGRISGTVKEWISLAGAAPAPDPTTYAVGSSIPDAGLYVGWDNSGDHLNGDVAELLLYKASLSTTDQGTLEAYLRARHWNTGPGVGPACPPVGRSGVVNPRRIVAPVPIRGAK